MSDENELDRIEARPAPTGKFQTSPAIPPVHLAIPPITSAAAGDPRDDAIIPTTRRRRWGHPVDSALAAHHTDVCRKEENDDVSRTVRQARCWRMKVRK